MAPKNARVVATLTTAVVVPDRLTMVPMHIESMNWARNTMLETMATSVPRPRIWLEIWPWPSWLTSN